ncbi:hypothetical protein [Georgenia sp. SUBG003]|uniref:hypothetical protein n=1 Tax=Georgenia sp. SUBG003 TaxID=1497974 RepID=UPI003AB39D32
MTSMAASRSMSKSDSGPGCGCSRTARRSTGAWTVRTRARGEAGEAAAGSAGDVATSAGEGATSGEAVRTCSEEEVPATSGAPSDGRWRSPSCGCRPASGAPRR